jgi:hypothetical protein
MNSFFSWHIFLEAGKTQDLSSKIWQTLEAALSLETIYHIWEMTKTIDKSWIYIHLSTEKNNVLEFFKQIKDECTRRMYPQLV